jgi:hypothetical protein
MLRAWVEVACADSYIVTCVEKKLSACYVRGSPV